MLFSHGSSLYRASFAHTLTLHPLFWLFTKLLHSLFSSPSFQYSLSATRLTPDDCLACAELSPYIGYERSELTCCKHHLRYLTYCCATDYVIVPQQRLSTLAVVYGLPPLSDVTCARGVSHYIMRHCVLATHCCARQARVWANPSHYICISVAQPNPHCEWNGGQN
jgi:hypothetical protein